MDREKLLDSFQAHYFSKREVLCRLPLNVPIDSFWTELINRRKIGATILPICNPAGQPYWFTLTEEMIAASEKLSEEALIQTRAFDPYRMKASSAIAQEMFFTSFVEGAQMTIQQAMEFLQKGSDPENIGEQVLFNNRNAWGIMLKSLFRPIDEELLHYLAYQLTLDLSSGSRDYRQVDIHPIAAMGSENYRLPAASAVPGIMDQLCKFLQRSDIHPLIKAGVGQALILTTRPFPEGNERLSRMISYAVLLRGGYDFFRDISISGMIAQSSYSYYKAMCEILREENDGDLTYFLTYYIGLLGRALEAKKEQDKQTTAGWGEEKPKQQEAEKSSGPIEVEAVVVGREVETFAEDGENKNIETFAGEDGENGNMEKESVKNTSESSRASPKNTDGPELIRKPVALSSMTKDEQSFLNVLCNVEKQSEQPLKDCAKIAMALLELGVMTFNPTRLVPLCYHLGTVKPNEICEEMVKAGMATREATDVGNNEYKLNIFWMQDEPYGPYQWLMDIPEEDLDLASGKCLHFLKALIRERKTEFITSDYRKRNPTDATYAGEALKSGIYRGWCKRMQGKASQYDFYYRLCTREELRDIRVDSLTIEMKRVAMICYQHVGNESFVLADVLKLFDFSRSYLRKHLDEMSWTGLLVKEKDDSRNVQYRLTVTPEGNPECFPVAKAAKGAGRVKSKAIEVPPDAAAKKKAAGYATAGGG